MKNLLTILFIALSISVSCQNKLSRETAKKLIIKSESYPYPKNFEILKSYTKDMHSKGNGATIVIGEDETKRNDQIYKLFAQNGLLTISETHKSNTGSTAVIGKTSRTWTLVEISLTDLGKKYLVQETDENYVVRLWNIDIDEITGIQETPQFNVATAYYKTINRDITPFGSIFNDKLKSREMDKSFSLYDDGWR